MDKYPTEKITYDAKWVLIDSVQSKRIATFSSEMTKGENIGGFKLSLKGKTDFKEIAFEHISSKLIPKMPQKDDALLDIDFLNKKKGLVENGVYTLDQLYDGRIILSGDNKIHVYDGLELKTFYVNSGFGDVRDFFEGQNGKMWIATTEGCFYFKDDRLYQLTTIGNTGIWRCYEDAKGILWLTTFTEGVFYFDDENCHNLRNDVLFTECKSFAEDDDGNLFLSAPPGVFKFGKTDTLLYPFDNIPGQTEKLFNWNGNILLGRFAGGLYMLKEKGFQQLKIGKEHNSIYSFDTTKTGLWICSYGGGIVHLKQDLEYTNYNDKHGIISGNGHKICADNFGNLWIGDIAAGLSVFRESQLKLSVKYEKAGQLNYSVVKGDTTFIFQSSGSPRMIVQNKLFELQSPISYDNPKYHRKGHVINANNIWIETFTRGPLQFSNNELNFYKYTDIPQETNAHNPISDKYGRIWFFNFRNNFSYLYNDTVHSFSKTNEISAASVNSTVIDRQHETYFIFDNYYLWVEKNQLSKYKFNDSATNIIYAFESQDRGVWLVTSTKLYKVEQGNIIQEFPVNLGYDIDINNGIEYQQKLYFSTSKGILIGNLNAKHTALQFYDESYGQHFINSGAFFETSEGLMYSSNSTNYTLEENWNIETSKKGEISIISVAIDDREVADSSSLTLERDEAIRFKIRSINWGKEASNLFRLIDQSGSKEFTAFNSNQIEFENLAPGNYTLEVKTRNSAGDSEVRSVSFYVNPYWYESKSFYFLILVVFVVLGYLYYRRRIKRSQVINEQLEKAVTDKTEELRQEKLEVEQQLNEKELLLKEINHRVKNNMQMVNSLVELQKSKESSTENKESLTQISQRVKALAFAHQHLYLQSQYEQIKVDDYLNLLIGKLVSNLAIKTQIEIDDKLMLPIEKGQALGLVLNELISNSIKHAKVEKGLELKLTIVQNPSGIEVVYSDNGLGFDLEKSVKKSLGMTLIDSFITRQLNGRFELNTIGNYSIKINFEI